MIDPTQTPQVRAELVKRLVDARGLYPFIRAFWEIASPGDKFEDSWHIGAIAEHCQAVSFREVKNLVITCPPRTGKTISVDVMWPAWHWTFQPEHRWTFLSYSDSLMFAQAERFLNVVQSELFQRAWPLKIPRRKKIGDFQNAVGGGRFSASIGGQVMGRGAHTQVVDDPVSTEEKWIKRAHDRVWQLFTGGFASRIDGPPEKFARVVMAQRVAEDDLPGRALTELGYEHLCLPMRHVPLCHWDRGSSLKFKDPRKAGESLSPRFSEVALQEFEKNPAVWEAEYQQNPTPAKGNIIDADWLVFEYESIPDGARWIQSWDFGFKGTDVGHSRVHGLLVAIFQEKVYWIDETDPQHLNYPESKALFTARQKDPLWAKAKGKYVEDKANGIAIMADLKDVVSGMIPVEPRGSKEERLIRHSDAIRGGYLLFPKQHHLLKAWRHEIISFPRGAYDDRVDTLTQAMDQAVSPDARKRALLLALAQRTAQGS